MNAAELAALGLLLFQAVSPPKTSRPFHWDWQNWQELAAPQSLRNAKMSSSDKAAIAKAIEEQLRLGAYRERGSPGAKGTADYS